MMPGVKSHPLQFVPVRDLRLAYVELGQGAPILFLHGNPTSSYLWRNVMPELSKLGRCIAPDLVGMGSSDKLDSPGPDSYRFATHQRYLDDFISALGIDNNLTLVVHDWGSALGFDWANRHPNQVRAIAYMEALVRPFADWAEWNEASTSLFQALRSPAGEQLILEKNVFIERILPGSILRTLSDEEMNHYRAPFRTDPESRWPTLTWPRQIPLAGEPADVVSIVQSYADYLSTSAVPKLFINAEPGAILCGATREYCRRWPNQQEVTVAGSHFLQEDSGPEIGQHICKWLAGLGVNDNR